MIYKIRTLHYYGQDLSIGEKLAISRNAFCKRLLQDLANLRRADATVARKEARRSPRLHRAPAAAATRIATSTSTPGCTSSRMRFKATPSATRPTCEGTLQQWLDEVADVRIHGTTGRQPRELFEAEESPPASLPAACLRRPFVSADVPQVRYAALGKTSQVGVRWRDLEVVSRSFSRRCW